MVCLLHLGASGGNVHEFREISCRVLTLVAAFHVADLESLRPSDALDGVDDDGERLSMKIER